MRPFIRFTVTPKVDATALAKAGSPVFVDQILVHVTSPGARDTHVAAAEAWLAKQKAAAAEGRIELEWYNNYVKSYELFKADQTNDALEGFMLRDWPPATPAQVETLRGAGVRSVEALASASIEVISDLGTGYSALQQKAKAWLDVRKDYAEASGLVETLRAQVAALETRNKSLEAQVAASPAVAAPGKPAQRPA